MDESEASDSEARHEADSEIVRELRRRLLDHYDAHRRALPWRKDDDPYRIWVSEVMLQQTRVDTVIPYYRRWIERFPRLDDLAAADQEDVLQMWKGLGYYSRARNLHRAARMVQERYDGRVPDSVKELKELPGVGDYTAGAVASIAFERSAPAVDGNVRRVLSRLYDLAAPGDAELRRRAAALVDPDRPGCFNQALMELGATICTPSDPECRSCPVEDFCIARSRGTVEERPRPRARAPVSRKTVAVAIPVSAEGRTLMVRRPEDGLLGGMWEFPSAEPVAVDGDAKNHDDPDWADRASARSARSAAEESGAELSADPPEDLGTLSHSFTHLRITYRLHLFRGAMLPGGGDQGQDDGQGDSSDSSGSMRWSGSSQSSRSPDSSRSSAVSRSSSSSSPLSSDARVVLLSALNDLPLPVAQQKIGRRAREFLEGKTG